MTANTVTDAVCVPSVFLLAALKCASTEETRYYLNGVFVKAVDDRTIDVVSTDGHKLFRAQFSLPEDQAAPAWLKAGAIISSENLARMVKMIETLNGEGWTQIECPKDGRAFVSDRGRFATFKVDIVDASFPDYEKVLSSDALEEGARDGAVIDTKIMRTATDVAAMLAKEIEGDNSIRWMPSQKSPNILTFAYPGTMMVAMPKRGDGVMPTETRRVIAPVTNGTVAALKAHKTRIQKALDAGQMSQESAAEKIAEYDARIAAVLENFAEKAIEDHSKDDAGETPAAAEETPSVYEEEPVSIAEAVADVVETTEVAENIGYEVIAAGSFDGGYVALDGPIDASHDIPPAAEVSKPKSAPCKRAPAKGKGRSRRAKATETEAA